MKYIAIDTSTQALSLALIEAGQVIAATTLRPNRQHGELLVPAVAQLMQQLGWDVADLAGLIIGVGPGSYTGLRIGATFAKTWATAKQLPVYPVSSLALMASGFSAHQLLLSTKGDTQPTHIIPLMDARRHSAYTGIYTWDASSDVNTSDLPILQTHTNDAHVEWRDWLKQVVAPMALSHVVLVGDEIDEFVDSFRELLPDTILTVVTGWQALPHAERAVHLALEAIDDATLLIPNYAHATLAEREWAEKNKKNIASEQDENEAFIEHFTE